MNFINMTLIRNVILLIMFLEYNWIISGNTKKILLYLLIMILETVYVNHKLCKVFLCYCKIQI